MPDIHLGDLCTIALACIGDRKGHATSIDRQITVGKRRITEPKAEWESHLNSSRVKIAVSHVKSFTVFTAALDSRIVRCTSHILQTVSISLIQLSARTSRSGQDIQHSGCSRLSAQITVHDRSHPVCPRHFHRRSGR